MKTSYHPAIIVAFYLNCLPNEILHRIPRTTQFDWKHKQEEQLFGFNWYQNNQQLFKTIEMFCNHRHLLKVNRALLFLLLCFCILPLLS